MLVLATFVYGNWIILKTHIFGYPVPGCPLLMSMILFLGGMPLMFIGVLGEYLGWRLDESKRRMLCLIIACEPFDTTRED